MKLIVTTSSGKHATTLTIKPIGNGAMITTTRASWWAGDLLVRQ